MTLAFLVKWSWKREIGWNTKFFQRMDRNCKACFLRDKQPEGRGGAERGVDIYTAVFDQRRFAGVKHEPGIRAFQVRCFEDQTVLVGKRHLKDGSSQNVL